MLVERERHEGRAMVERELPDPIFIHGILPRSGTNFLWDLLLLHPDCAAAVEPIREDLFLDHSDHLVAFIRAVRDAWDPRWGQPDPELAGRLHRSVGDGLISFLRSDHDHRLVTKSPSVRNLQRFFSFFPTARLVILVRDGRAVTQSCMETFGWSFERAARAWADGAREIRRFQREHEEQADRWRLVRYEDLVDDLDSHLPGILEFLGLDVAAYDMDAARDLPVRGSSTFFGPGRSSVHWEPVQKDASFSPNERWRSWSPQRVERFEWIAGDGLRALGYGTDPASGPSLGAASRHALLDGWWTTRRAAARGKEGLAAASRPLRRRLGLAR